MVDEGLSSIVHWLVNGDVDDMGADAGGYDKVAEALALKDLTGILAAIYHSVD